MNKKLRGLITALAILGSSMLLNVACNAGCGNEEPDNSGTNNPAGGNEQPGVDNPDDETPESGEITLSEMSKTLDRYEKFTLTADKAGVTWSSSDTSVATVVDGVVQACGVGTATITATNAESVASCVVTVEDSGAVPTLQLDDEALTLVVGDDYALTSAVYYKREVQTDAEITYDVEDDSIISVATDGTITALKYGETKLTVSASWHGVDSDFLTQTITVKVQEDVVCTIAEEDFTLYTSNVTIEGEDFANTKTLTGSVAIGGSTSGVDATRITWVSDNEAVATVSASGVVTAKTEGTANIQLKYVTELGEYLSEPVEVTVTFPTIDKTETILLDVDATLDTFNAQLTGMKVFGVDKAITRVVTQDDPDTNILNDDVWIEEHNTGDEEARTHLLTIYNADYAYRVRAIVVTKVISEYEHLTKLLEYAGATATDVGSYCNYSGYFVLANNIIAPENATAINTNSRGKLASAGDVVNTNGFSGTFDGRGYSIVNANFGAGGLLGDISKNGVVKNLAIVDATITEDDVANAGAGVLGFGFCGKAENIFVSYTTTKARSGVFGRYTYGGSVKDMVVYYKKAGGYNNGAITSWNVNALVVENLKVVYAAGMSVADSKMSGETTSYSGDYTEIKEENLSSETFGGFNEAYWSVVDGALPVFKTTVGGLALNINGGAYQDEIQVNLNMEIKLTATVENIAGTAMNYCPITWKSSDETVATVENGVLTFKNAGTTTITASCGARSKTVVVKVAGAAAAIDKTSKTLYLESSNTASLKDQILAEATEADLFETFTVTQITDAFDMAQTDLTASSGWIKSVDDADANRERTLFVYGDNVAYKVKVMVVTKVISTADELANLINYATDKKEISSTYSGTSYKTWSYGGYFILGGDITNSTSAPITIAGPAIGSITANVPGSFGWDAMKDTNNGNAFGNMGFHGTFDGQGYTVDGFTYGIGGVFGGIGSGAVIKNVAFTNCVADTDSNDATRHGGVLAQFAHGGTNPWTIDNVYVQGKIDTIHGGMLTGYSCTGGTVSNTVVQLEATGGEQLGAIAKEAGAAMQNVVVVHVKGARGYYEYKPFGSVKTAIPNGLTQYELQADGTVKKITATPAHTTHTEQVGTPTISTTVATSGEFSKFDKMYWLVVSGYAPKFKVEYTNDGKKVIDLRAEKTLTLEVRSEATLGEQIVSNLQPFFGSKITLEDASSDYFKITSIYEGDDATTDLRTDIGSSNGFMQTLDTMRAEADRTKDLTVIAVWNGEEILCKVKAIVVTKIITTAEELNNLITYANNVTTIYSSKNSHAQSYDGYFVLGANLIADENSPIIQGPAMRNTDTGVILENLNSFTYFQNKDAGDSVGDMGFHGTFDGRGYTVDGFTYGVGGVFGLLGTNAVVKNVSFTNCSMDADANVKNTAVLAQGAYATSANPWLIENVYVQATMKGNNCAVMLGSYASAGKFVDVVVRVKALNGWMIAALATGSDCTMENVVVVYDETSTNGCREFVVFAQRPIANTETSAFAFAGVSEYVLQSNGTVKKITNKVPTDNGFYVDSYTTEENVAITTDFAGFDTAYWSISAGFAPTFKLRVL